LPKSVPALNRPPVSVQIARGARDLQARRLIEVRFPQLGSRAQGEAMEGKARFIFPVMISALIVFVVSGAVTFTNIGLRADFVPRWLKAFITGWPVAAVLAFVAVPHIRRATEAIVRLIEGYTLRYCSGLIPSVSPILLLSHAGHPALPKIRQACPN
jgi:hypothetical protein